MLIIIFIAILGMILGSFYACMGYRIPNKIPLTKPNSFCENCKKELFEELGRSIIPRSLDAPYSPKRLSKI